MDIFLIDAISPFFKGYKKGKRINWSKIPFEHLEKNGEANRVRLEKITLHFAHFCARASEIGYNAITLDDMAHMISHPDYEIEVQNKIEVYAEFYQRWISIAKQHGLKVFITTDFLFTTPASAQKIGDSYRHKVIWFRE